MLVGCHIRKGDAILDSSWMEVHNLEISLTTGEELHGLEGVQIESPLLENYTVEIGQNNEYYICIQIV